MYGLFLKTYDYYEWNDLICISESRQKLRDRHATGETDGLYGDRSLFEYVGDTPKGLRDKETVHFVIQIVEVL